MQLFFREYSKRRKIDFLYSAFSSMRSCSTLICAVTASSTNLSPLLRWPREILLFCVYCSFLPLISLMLLLFSRTDEVQNDKNVADAPVIFTFDRTLIWQNVDDVDADCSTSEWDRTAWTVWPMTRRAHALVQSATTVSYTHLTLPTNREV